VTRGLLALVFLALSTPALADPASSPLIGRWLTQDGDGVLAVAPCGDGLCVRIVGSAKVPMPRDWEGRSQCNLQIAELTQSSPGAWQGNITDPRSGRVYDVRMAPVDNDHLSLRGFVFVPLLGSTQIWSRFTGHVTEDCRMEG
jgi:uncharacterized protein (DUF2147 family)